MKRPALAVDRRSLEQQAADALREAILAGRYIPGTRLTEMSLAAELGLSRGTVRGALQQLVHEGLAVLEPYKGWAVRSLSAQDAWEIYTLRNALEGLATRIVAEAITPEKAAAVDGAFVQLRQAVEQGRRERIVRADFQLHRTIMQLSGHGRLQAQYQIIEKQTQLFFNLAGAFLELGDYIDLHTQLVDAIKAGKAELAERIASEHNTIDGAALVKRLAVREREGAPRKSPQPGARLPEPR